MAKQRPSLDEIMRQTHTVAELTLMLTGPEVLDLAKLVRYVLEHPKQFDDEESRAASRTSDIVRPPKFCKWRWRPRATVTAKATAKASSCYDLRMMNPMPKLPLALLALAMMTGIASAQQRTYYDASGKVVGRSASDSSGTTTNYDARGRVISPESTTGNPTTIYDAGGRNVGRLTTNR